jgi:hypothetical protein
MVLNWFKWFSENKDLENTPITSSVSQLEVKTVMPIRFLEYLPTETCKTHRDYTGMIPPKNNCNRCWEYYSKKIKR